MGYSQQRCQICGVSFNIARLRRPDEPRSAAWEFHNGYGGGESFVAVTTEDDFRRCGAASGCLVLDRDGGDEDDKMQTPWEKNAETSSPASSGPNDSEANDTDEAFAPNAHDSDQDDDSEYALRNDIDISGWEHIAGPGCQWEMGFSGWRISLEQMKNCRTFQCLVRKSDDFVPAYDDQLFERTGKWFLSGLGDWMRSAENLVSPFPTRHGVQWIMPSNSMHPGAELKSCMPFHPWCLEVWKRVSGNDVEGLMRWYEHEADVELVRQFPRDGPVKSLSQQYWRHRPGTEWLAANPLFVPGMQDVLDAALTEDENFNAGNGAFDIDRSSLTCPGSDVFGTLPMELRLLLLSHLPSRDIANFRLASRSFRQIPIQFWRHLVNADMPWLWEAWDTSAASSYSCWAATTELELMRSHVAQRDEVLMPSILARGRINWYKLYLGIKQNWLLLQGLQNRQRIWRDCEEILRRVERYRQSGDLSAQDLVSLVAKRTEENRKRTVQQAYARAQHVVTHLAPA